MERSDETRTMIIQATLTVAVPLWIARLSDISGEDRDHTIWQWSRDLSDALSSPRGAFLTGGPSTVNATARGLAALACRGGGVQFLGTLWCSDHCPDGREPEPWEALCALCGADGRLLDKDRYIRMAREILAETNREVGRV